MHLFNSQINAENEVSVLTFTVEKTKAYKSKVVFSQGLHLFKWQSQDLSSDGLILEAYTSPQNFLKHLSMAYLKFSNNRVCDHFSMPFILVNCF